MWSAARSAKISMILCMPERVSGGDAKFQGFCDRWNKWEGQLARRHDVSRNLIRIWVSKLEAGAFDEDVEAAGLLQEYEAKIAAFERLVGRQALEIEFLKGALKSAPRPRSATTSVIAGPMVSPSPKDAD